VRELKQTWLFGEGFAQGRGDLLGGVALARELAVFAGGFLEGFVGSGLF